MAIQISSTPVAATGPSWVSSLVCEPRPVVLFTRQLAGMYRAGVTLDRSLLTLSFQTEEPALAFVILGLLSCLRRGDSLSSAMSAYPRVFPETYQALVIQGEVSGNLAGCLEQAADLLERSDALRRRVQTASLYPGFVLATGVAGGFLSMHLMAPFLLEVFGHDPHSLPPATRVLAGLIAFLQGGPSTVAVLVLGLLGLAWTRLRLGTPTGRLWRDRLLLRLPLLGPVIRALGLGRVARTLGASVRSGLRFPTALTLCAQVAGNEPLRLGLLEARCALLRGVPLERFFRKRQVLFTPLFAGMFATGQEAGNLEAVCERLADLLETEAECRLETLLSLLQPLLIAGLGVAVGGLALAVLQPIYALL